MTMTTQTETKYQATVRPQPHPQCSRSRRLCNDYLSLRSVGCGIRTIDMSIFLHLVVCAVSLRVIPPFSAFMNLVPKPETGTVAYDAHPESNWQNWDVLRWHSS